MSYVENQSFFTSYDETALFYRSWKPTQTSNKAIIHLHRGHEHSGRLSELVKDLDLPEFWSFGFDLRGHGNSPGERGYAESYSSWVKDLNHFVTFISHKHDIPMDNIAIVANSVGAVTTSVWVHDYAPCIRCMVLAAPAFRIKLYIPFAIVGLRLLQLIKPKSFITSYVKSSMLTHDKAEAKRYDKDPLITKNIAVNILLGLHDSSSRIIDDAAAINTPTLILSAGSDCVVETTAQRRFFDALSSSIKEFQAYEGFSHAIFFEKKRALPIARTREFILKSFARENDTTFLQNAHLTGFTKDEFERLKAPCAEPMNTIYKLIRLGIQTVGRLSKGIHIGNKEGFDSGESLDHIYLNKATGITPLGKIIAWGYLQAIGWKGIRQRKINLMMLLEKVIKTVSASCSEVRIMDVASGPGRYLIETAAKLKVLNISLQLRDFTKRNLVAAKKIANELDVKKISFSHADAFDRDSLANVSERPNIVVVSGLYELFSENEMVSNSLAGIADSLQDNGYLIYTGQPWHPQVEFIARTLSNRDGNRWIMRRRTQAEMDELVRSAGFTKLETVIDDFGIFTVSIAQKRRIK